MSGTDLGGWARLGREGVDLLMSDSTNAEVPGFVTPEREIGPVLDDVFRGARRRIIVACCMIAGACAGIAGFFEVAAIQGDANASLVAGYGFTGILVSFLARHNPVAIVPVSVMFGGIVAAGGIIQRRMGLPDATVLVLQGLIFIVLLISETLYGRFEIFKPDAKDRA